MARRVLVFEKCKSKDFKDVINVGKPELVIHTAYVHLNSPVLSGIHALHTYNVFHKPRRSFLGMDNNISRYGVGESI